MITSADSRRSPDDGPRRPILRPHSPPNPSACRSPAHSNSASQSIQPITSLNLPRAAKVPPQIVIRATRAYKAQRIFELSFDKGDFFHVVGQRAQRDGSDWFEAENPLNGSRGIVPAGLFDQFGKPHRDRQLASSVDRPPPSQIPPAARSPHLQLAITASPEALELRSRPQILLSHASNRTQSSDPSHSASDSTYPSSFGGDVGPKKPPLYGIVKHSFEAEQPEELTVQKGEPLIIMAHSEHHDWFVVQPIGRLGGPGLLPVGYVQVQDMTTGDTLSSVQVQDLIKASVIPPVTQWKQARAAYKGNTIPLGRLDIKPEKLRAKRSLPNFPSTFVPETRFLNPNADEANHAARLAELADRYGTVTRFFVHSFHLERGRLWFQLRVQFRQMQRAGNPKTVMILYRLYDDFVAFNLALHGACLSRPEWNQVRLPHLSQNSTPVDEARCPRLMAKLQQFLNLLSATPRDVRESEAVVKMFAPRNRDAKLHSEIRVASQKAIGNEVVECLARMTLGKESDQQAFDASVVPRGPSLSCSDSSSPPRSAKTFRGSGSASDGWTNSSSLSILPAIQSSLSSQSTSTRRSSPFGISVLKIKIHHLETDDLIAIRVPAQIDVPGLTSRIKERLGRAEHEHITLQFKDDQMGSLPVPKRLGVGWFRPISSEEELDEWIESGKKLVLYV